MKYLYLLYADESKMPAPDSPQMQQQEAAFGRYYEELSGRGMFKAGDPVQPSKTATTVRVQDGRTLTTDGPFAETKDALGGYYQFEAEDLDAAIEIASRIPAARLGGAIEVRPVVER